MPFCRNTDIILSDEENAEEFGEMEVTIGELYGSINACRWDGRITKEQADYMRTKYLFGDTEEEEDLGDKMAMEDLKE